ncbi:MAG: ATP-dependent DNA helicase [Actinomycetota bacterium]|nr:ATP-dependent DNA helicase [Actinomycetota bacterium]
MTDLEIAPDTTARTVLDALGHVRDAMVGAERRAGQEEMAVAVAEAIESGEHLMVQAGTGTGKSLAYLVPAICSGKRTVVATATLALQDQLANKDLPQLAATLPVPFSHAVLKGRSNYVCRQRLAELAGDGQQGLDLPGGSRPSVAELAELRVWAATSDTGDRAELAREPSPAAWDAVSVGARDCPGATNCPSGGECFAERARRAAAQADVIVTNLHLYGVHVASGGSVLPEHEVVVIDEAHQLEDVVTATSGLELGPGRIRGFRSAAAAVLADAATVEPLDASAADLEAVLTPRAGSRLRSTDEALASALARLRDRTSSAIDAVRGLGDQLPADAAGKRQRALVSGSALVDDIDRLTNPAEGDVRWVEQVGQRIALRSAPVDVGALLADRLWDEVTAVLTSATLPPALDERVGLPVARRKMLDVGSPFDHEGRALLYCAAHLPEPRSTAYEPAAHDEIARLIEAAGGRTLALFTSFRAMRAAVDAVRERVDVPILVQGDRPKPALIAEFGADEAACLFATMGFWQGIDVPGRSLSLVILDRIPFPRPDEPLVAARRERAGPAAFSLVDLPRAATLLAQGAGRLLRTANDEGVVAVLDSRLANRRAYRWDLINALPPMRRTRRLEDATARLREIAAG